jgi:predicted negative regulator of RcsB-dependent stress response
MQVDFNQIVVIVAFLVSVFNLWDKIDARRKAAKEPTKALENRIANLEQLTSMDYTKRFENYDFHFKRDLERIEKIEEGNKVTQQALLALLNHAIDGNDIAEVRKASKDLTDYLIKR